MSGVHHRLTKGLISFIISQMGSSISNSCPGIKWLVVSLLMQKTQRKTLPVRQERERGAGTRHGAMDVARKTSEIEVLWNGCLRKAAKLGDLEAYK